MAQFSKNLIYVCLAVGAGVLISGCHSSENGAVTQNVPTSANPTGNNSDGSSPNPTHPSGSSESPNVSANPKVNTGKPVITPISSAPGEGGWKANQFTAAELGDKIDANLAKLSDVAVNVQVHAVLPIGTGDSNLDGIWKSPTTYKVEFVSMGKERLLNKTVLTNNRMMSMFIPTEKETSSMKIHWTSPVPMPKPETMTPKEILDQFPDHVGDLALGMYQFKGPIYGRLLRAIADPQNGYEYHIETRNMTYKSKIVTNYRVYASNKAKGTSFQIVVDGERFYPVTIETRSPGVEWDWDAAWKPGTYTSTTFILPKKTVSA